MGHFGTEAGIESECSEDATGALKDTWNIFWHTNLLSSFQ